MKNPIHPVTAFFIHLLLFIPVSDCRLQGSHVPHCTNQLIYIAHLVVVPGNYSYLINMSSALLCQSLSCIEK